MIQVVDLVATRTAEFLGRFPRQEALGRTGHDLGPPKDLNLKGSADISFGVRTGDGWELQGFRWESGDRGGGDAPRSIRFLVGELGIT